MANFKKVECKGFNREEAISNAPFQVIRDATQAWKNAGMPMSDSELKLFMEEYLLKHTKMAEGIGCSITFKAGVADSRQRPYKFEDVKNEKGKRKYQTVFQIVDKKTNEKLGEVAGTKSDAKEFVRKLYCDKGYRGDVKATYIKTVSEGEPAAFEAKYTPSVNATEGVYVCFGVE